MENNNKKEVSFTNPVPVPEKNISKVSISTDDLKIILNIITVCAKRNAFQLEEYKVISELNDRLKLLAN